MIRLVLDPCDLFDSVLTRIARLPVIRAVLCRRWGHMIKMDADGSCIRCGRSYKELLGDEQRREERGR